MVVSSLDTSDAPVPGKAVFRRRGAPTLADVFHGVGHDNAGEVLQALKAKLAGDAHTNRSAVGRGKLLPVHPISKQGLWMISVEHIEAAPLFAERKALFAQR